MATTEKQFRDAYSSKGDLLEEMLGLKPIEELCELYDDETFIAKGQGKTDRFYGAITGKGQSPSSEKDSKKTTYVALWAIRRNGEEIAPKTVVDPKDFGDEFDRLLKIGAIGLEPQEIKTTSGS